MKRALPIVLLLTACGTTTQPQPTAGVMHASNPTAVVPAVSRPFGAHAFAYPPGSIRPSGGQPALDAAVRAAYDRWKAAYITTGCGGHYVKSPGEPGQVTSSPANAAGMMILAFLAGHDPEAQAIFDGILTVSRHYPSYLEHRSGNLSYAIVMDKDGHCAWPKDKKGNDTGDSSVLGDLDFGFALLLGERQWGTRNTRWKYADEAKKTIATIRQYDVNPDSRIPLIGDWASLPGEPVEWKTSGKPSNFMLGHFRAFARAEDSAFWSETVEKLHALTDATVSKFSANTGLLPLYLRHGHTPPPGKMLSDQNAGHFVGDAGAIPFRFAADYLASRDPRTRAALDRMLAWAKGATGGDPGKLVGGYRLDGTALGEKPDITFIAPFASAAIFDGAHQQWLDAAWKLMVAAQPGNQHADTMTLLNMVLVSGNWWQP